MYGRWIYHIQYVEVIDMARSTYIYLLYKRLFAKGTNIQCTVLVGGFTVKYEMENYVKKNPGFTYLYRRLKDGDPGYFNGFELMNVIIDDCKCSD